MTTVITFPTTADAFAFEAAAKAAALPGRLSTIPRSLSAGCGFAWSAPSEAREQLVAFVAQRGLEVEGVHEV